MNATMILDLLSRSPRATLAGDIVAKATLVLAAAGVASLLLRRSSAAARHLAWCLGLAAALAIPVLSFALPGWSWSVLPMTGDDGTDSQGSRALAPAPVSTAMITSPDDQDGRAFEGNELDGAAPAPRPTTAPTIAPPPARTWRLPPPSWSWIWAVWLAGSLGVLARPVAGRIALRRLTRDARPIDDADWRDLLHELATRLGLTRRVVLLRSPGAAMPMTWGGVRPVVLLPAEADAWGLDRRRAVLLHELAHVRRFDCLTQWLAVASCALYWFHPLAWVASRRMRIERERACDDVVLLAGARASDYADHLLEIARGLRVATRRSDGCAGDGAAVAARGPAAGDPRPRSAPARAGPQGRGAGGVWPRALPCCRWPCCASRRGQPPTRRPGKNRAPAIGRPTIRPRG